MQVLVVYLGGSRGHTGCAQQTLDLEPGATVADLAHRVSVLHSDLAPRLTTCRWARNHEFADADDPLNDGDEVALVPPVSGGAPACLLTTKPLSPQAALEDVVCSKMGATVLFVGTVRDHARGKDVERLDYEAYRPMADRQLEVIANACRSEHEGVEITIHHRYGSLDVGDISVVIAAAAPHREAAFDACRAALERIKSDVPIWKNERTTDGAEWVGWGGG